MSEKIRFILNNCEVITLEHPGISALDYLRRNEKLVGTKEGCREGDCGACVVLLGELTGDCVSYKQLTSCLLPIGELHGKHLVTIEGLNMEILSPVHEAIAE